MFKLSQIILRSTKSTRLPLIRYNAFIASSVAPVKSEEEHLTAEALVKSSKHHSIVAAAFASLNSNTTLTDIKTPHTDTKIENAKTVDALLSISDGTGVSRRHALKVVSILSEWTSKGTVQLSDFETDTRFLRLCRVLTKTPSNGNNNRKFATAVANRSEDLSTILSVTADDEAAKLVASITLPQMIKVLATLAKRKRRSTLLLRSLAYNITACPDKLNLKESGDLLYSMTVLNFPDENLLERISNDICEELPTNTDKSAVIGSIITSVGLLRYKNVQLLEGLADWMLKSSAICRAQDIFSFFMTLAMVNHLPSNAEQLFKELVPTITVEEAGKPQTWLDVVWSLVLLDQAKHKHVASILNDDFLKSFQENQSTSTSMKILNIDASAKYLMKNYTGPRLSTESSIHTTHILRSKDKNALVEAVNDTLKNLIHDEKYLRSNIDTGLGFYIDVELFVDKKCHPLPLEQRDSNPDGIKIAILTLDFHDMCRGKLHPNGVNVLAKKLLEAQGYRVVFVPYTEFKVRDKIVVRVKYIQDKLKETLAL